MDTFNPRDLISLAKYKWGSGATGTYNQGWFQNAADTVRSNLGVTNYGKDVSLDPTFDYNKVDWGSVSSQLNDWQTNGTEQQKAVANLYLPMMTNLGVSKDRGIYYAADLQSKATNLTNQGALNAQKAQAEAVAQNPGHANTIAFYEQAKADAVTSLTEQAALLKKQAEADYASGREQIEADYSGVEQDILASVAKLQRMSGDEFAARGMAFSGSLNQAVADIAAAGASELAKSMAQKGAQLGKLTQELVKYTAQIDLDTLNNKTKAVMEYGLQMAALMDEDAQVKAQAEAVLAGLEEQQKTQDELAPITTELGRAKAEGDYATAQNEAAQQNFENSLKLSQLGLDERAQDLAENEAQLKYRLAYDQLDLDKQKLVLDEMYKKGQLSIDQYDAITRRMNATTAAANVGGKGTSGGGSDSGLTFNNAQSIITDYTGLEDKIAGFKVNDEGNYERMVFTNGVQNIETLSKEGYDALKTRLADMQGRYQEAVKMQNALAGLPTTSTQATNIKGFIDRVAMATRGVGSADYASALLDSLYNGKPLRESLDSAELKAIQEYYGID